MAPASIHPIGESALLVSLGHDLSEQTNSLVHSLTQQLRDLGIEGVVDLVPAYSSLLIRFDPRRLDQAILRGHIETSLSSAKSTRPRPGVPHMVPVRYGGEHGPDLEALAAERGLTVSDVVRLHSGQDYRV